MDTNVDFTWSTTTPFANSGYYCIRWLGQVQPQYSETYYFVANTDDGVKLWVNDQLIVDAWTNKSASDLTGTINLQGGVRYNLKMEYYHATGTALPPGRLSPGIARTSPSRLFPPAACTRPA